MGLSQEDKNAVIKILLARMDIAGAAGDILELVLEPALEKMVADTANPYDDMAKAALYPILAQVIKAEIKKLLDGLKPEAVAV